MAAGPQDSEGRSSKASGGLESGTPTMSLVLKSKGQSKSKTRPGSREGQQRHDNLSSSVSPCCNMSTASQLPVVFEPRLMKESQNMSSVPSKGKEIMVEHMTPPNTARQM